MATAPFIRARPEHVHFTGTAEPVNRVPPEPSEESPAADVDSPSPRRGVMEWPCRRVQNDLSRGLEVVARDQGPGIADTSKAMQDGFSTSRSLGFGLPGSRRLMDKFRVQSKIDQGTTVIMRKWLP
jgi:hypothetical protein